MTVDTRLLDQRASAIHNRYLLRFAGHSRLTRDRAEMKEIIADTQAFLAELSIPEAEDLRTQVNERLEMYRTEDEAIVQAQAGGPNAILAAALGQRANFVINRYRRHFAGKGRKTRDLGLLAECVANLKAIKAEMTTLLGSFDDQSLKDDHKVVERSLELYIKERGEIVAARGMGLIDQKAELLAELANNQFALYRVHFAGQSRISRRPSLMGRVVDNLVQVRDRMMSHKTAGLRSTANDRNIQVITDQLKMYRQELKAIESSRAEAGPQGQIDALAAAANAVMAKYTEHFAGQNRASRDLDLLSNLCDQLGDTETLMHALQGTNASDINGRNLHIVRDMLTLYEREYKRVQEAKKS